MALRRNRVRAESRARYYIRAEAQKRGWQTHHVGTGGDFLEENEILAHFPDCGLGLDKPDFLVCVSGDPTMVVEAKNESGRIQNAIAQAIEYADRINATARYRIRIAVGAVGQEDTGFIVEARFLTNEGWRPLQSRGIELTTIPARREVELALEAGTGDTNVSIPLIHEYIDAAIELSVILRRCRVEAFLRPRVIGALVLALYQDQIDVRPERALASINALTQAAIEGAIGIAPDRRTRLIDAIRLSGADFDRLAPSIGRIVAILRRLNVRSVLQTDTDFLGMFYEAFLRYGYDNNALGIVFTPRHITRFCVELVGAGPNDRVIDIASGTGGFLIAAFEKMLNAAQSLAAIEQVKSAIYGFDTNPTVWALSTLNMFFRGDGKSHLEHGSSLDEQNRQLVRRRFTRAFLNPPFSQEGEPERDFIDASMEALEPGGCLSAVVAAGVFADDEHRGWRQEFLRRHSLLGMISLPEDLFYPTAAPTTIIVAQAHLPQRDEAPVLMARIWHDGFEKLKGRRIERGENQLSEVLQAFRALHGGDNTSSEIAHGITGSVLRHGNGIEWSPQQWLPQPDLEASEFSRIEQQSVQSLFQAVAQFPDLADEALPEFGVCWSGLPSLPIGETRPLDFFFQVLNGKSAGEKNYSDGTCPYVSSGDVSNSIVRLVTREDEQVFGDGGLCVTAFGNAVLQPWPFMARGNGGSAVRVLIPRFRMGFRELVWFAAQINAQRWRFFYARMAIKSRIERLEITSPPRALASGDFAISDKLRAFRDALTDFSQLTSL